jgi:hypothetical protein
MMPFDPSEPGNLIASGLDGHFPLNLSYQPQFFELAVLAIGWIILLAFVGWTYSRSMQTFKKISKDMLLFLMALIFFGLIVNMAESVKSGPMIILGSDILEDAGETVVLSLILWYVFVLIMRNGEPGLFLHNHLKKKQENQRS